MNTQPSPSNLPDTLAALAASVVGLVTRRHLGAGVLWRPGLIVGSAAVLWRASSVGVVLAGGERVSAELCGLDASTDLAAVRFNSGDLPVAARVTDAAPRVGDFVYAVGRTADGLTQASFGHLGLVGGAWRTWRGGRVDSLIRLDGGLYPGLDGAPVADANGQVLGIASSALARHHGVVLPVATVDRVVDQLLIHGRVQHGYLGIAAQPVRATVDGAAVEGLLVSSVAEDGPAARGGLLVGDVLLGVAGQAVEQLDALRGLLTVGAQVLVDVARGGQRLQLTLDVAERPQTRCG